MATTTNLELFLPQSNDYVNVKRDLSDNFQAIDDAFTISDITSTLTFTDCTHDSGSVRKIGRLVVGNIRIATTAEIGLNKIFISGLPLPNDGAKNSIIANTVYRQIEIRTYVTQEGNVTTSGYSAPIPSGSAVIVSFVYFTMA